MPDKNKSRGRTDTVFVLAVFCFFTVSAVVSLTFGAAAYKSILEKSRNGKDEQICLSYIWTKIKNGDEAGRVYIDNFFGMPALFLDEEHDEIIYQTVIYFYDGWVYELFCEKGLEFEPLDGARVIEAESLVFEQTDEGLIKTTVNSKSLFVSLRSDTNARKHVPARSAQQVELCSTSLPIGTGR